MSERTVESLAEEVDELRRIVERLQEDVYELIRGERR